MTTSSAGRNSNRSLDVAQRNSGLLTKLPINQTGGARPVQMACRWSGRTPTASITRGVARCILRYACRS